MLLGALRILQENRENLNGNVKFVFQSSEEQLKGASVAIEEGALENVDAEMCIRDRSQSGTDGD